MGTGEFASGEVLDLTDEARAAAKARSDLCVADPGVPQGKDPSFQWSQDVRSGHRCRPRPTQCAELEDLGDAPSAAPEPPGNLGQIDAGVHEPFHSALEWP
ncbi:MAG TPA: hypothetical protein DCQ30_07335 [Acidimicrobiaceae bacterium]|nr:hypothetical protein [Acidimicrobiaceae bacterium]